jgi:hypothetical protein
VQGRRGGEKSKYPREEFHGSAHCRVEQYYDDGSIHHGCLHKRMVAADEDGDLGKKKGHGSCSGKWR